MPTSADLRGCVHLSDPKPMRGPPSLRGGGSPAALVTLDNLEPIAGFDSGEGA
uniref:Uncharacterized protein n=1 Tax=Takifugu rubripes TaxID=31033 RepID=A0A674MXR3_TAKRU